MAAAEKAIRDCREARGMAPDPASDINRTGLIGIEAYPGHDDPGEPRGQKDDEQSELRRACRPAFRRRRSQAGRHGRHRGLSSFPALVVAVLAAAQAAEVEPVLIWSLGASQWGANDPAFDGLDIYDCLERGPVPEEGSPPSRSAETGAGGGVGPSRTATYRGQDLAERAPGRR